MRLPLRQRRLLGAFLRSHRERLHADTLGLASRAARRRTPGLRREEVADACGLSPTWYTWIEQARDISVSAAALARLAAALRLSPAERSYLFELARARDPEAPAVTAPRREDDPQVTLQPALDALVGPAYLMDPHWCATAWNAPALGLFADWFGLESRCLLDYMFFDRRSRELVPDWEDRAKRLAAEFRADTGRRPDDPVLRALTERLREGSAEFAAFWTNHSVLGREGGPRHFTHPALGSLVYTQINLLPARWPDYRLVMLVEIPETAP